MIENSTRVAKRHLQLMTAKSPQIIDWVTPVLSTVLAASTHRVRPCSEIRFSRKARAYAENNNLRRVLEGEHLPPQNTGLQGVTYTKLTRLSTHSEVDGCNRIINDLLYSQFASFSPTAASMMGKVVGELHDNIPSHAAGAGYSCAQVYQYGRKPCVIFSIADSGRGMLSNVQKVNGVISREDEAIRWCLEKGNTSARPADPWAQRLPEDSMGSPFPLTTPTFSEENHHVGHGLWQLCELVKEFNGKLWILSGNQGSCAEYWYHSGRVSCQILNLDWQGVAVSFQLKIPKHEVASSIEEASLNDLGRRLGI